ncbi:hypothetical protein NFI96_016735 [Prochilodus magdalenae]|nr:hypothetical protein NFI96_016735 [Prochilodus magdalenae]
MYSIAYHLPLFEELHLVPFGCHYAGKNTVGNAILRKHVFKYKTTYERYNAKRERAVFGRRITIVRVPGWYGDLTLEEGQPEINQEIRDCMKEFQNGPHAIILCVKENTTEIGDGRRASRRDKNLLSDDVWNHTIIVFTKGKKLKNKNIDKHIKDKDLQVHMGNMWEKTPRSHKMAKF